MLHYCLDRYKILEICEKAADACLPALKFIPDWLVTYKMFKDLDNTVFFNKIIDLDNDDCDNVTFFYDNCYITLSNVFMSLANINLNDVNTDDDLDTINLVKLTACCNIYNTVHEKETNTELMSTA